MADAEELAKLQKQLSVGLEIHEIKNASELPLEITKKKEYIAILESENKFKRAGERKLSLSDSENLLVIHEKIQKASATMATRGRLGSRATTNISSDSESVGALSGDSLKLFRWLALLPAEQNLLKLFEHRSLLGDQSKVQAALKDLRTYCKIIDNEPGEIGVEKVLHGSMRENALVASLSCKERNDILWSLKEGLVDLYPDVIKQPNEYYGLSKKLLPPLEAVAAHYKDFLSAYQNELSQQDYKTSALARGSLLMKIADAHQANEKFTEEIEVYEDARSIYEQYSGTTSLQYSAVLNNLALSYGHQAEEIKKLAQQGKMKDVEADSQCRALLEKEKKLLEESWIIEKAHGTRGLSYAATLSNLAVVYSNLEMKNFEKQIEMLIESMAIHEIIHGKSWSISVECGSTTNNLALAYGKIGEKDKEIGMLNKVLSIYIVHYGDMHKKTGFIHENLSISYSNARMHEKSVYHGDKAAAIIKQHYGEQHPRYLSMLRVLVDSSNAMNDCEKAMTRALELISILKGSGKGSTTEYGDALALLASVHGNPKKGEYQKQIALLEEAISIYKENKADVSNIKGYALVWIAFCKAYEPLWKQSASFCVKYGQQLEITLPMCAKAFGFIDVSTKNVFISINNLLVGMINEGKPDVAVGQNLVTAMEKMLNKDTAEFYLLGLTSLSNICGSQKIGNFEKQESLLQKAIDAYKKFGLDHSSKIGFANAHYYLSCAYEKLADKDPKTYLRKYGQQLRVTLPIYETAIGKDRLSVDVGYKNLITMSRNLGVKLYNTKDTAHIDVAEIIAEIMKAQFGYGSDQHEDAEQTVKYLRRFC